MELQVGGLNVVEIVANGVAEEGQLAATIVSTHDGVEAMTAQPEG